MKYLAMKHAIWDTSVDSLSFFFSPSNASLKNETTHRISEKIFFDPTEKIAQQMPRAEVRWQPSTLCESEDG